MPADESCLGVSLSPTLRICGEAARDEYEIQFFGGELPREFIADARGCASRDRPGTGSLLVEVHHRVLLIHVYREGDAGRSLP